MVGESSQNVFLIQIDAASSQNSRYRSSRYRDSTVYVSRMRNPNSLFMFRDGCILKDIPDSQLARFKDMDQLSVQHLKVSQGQGVTVSWPSSSYKIFFVLLCFLISVFLMDFSKKST